MIYTALCIMFWMRAYPLRGQEGGGWALEFESIHAVIHCCKQIDKLVQILIQSLSFAYTEKIRKICKSIHNALILELTEHFF